MSKVWHAFFMLNILYYRRLFVFNRLIMFANLRGRLHTGNICFLYYNAL